MKKFAPIRELLKDCYEILSGIPTENFRLQTYVSAGVGHKPSCNTIACGAGWLAMHPVMKKLLNIRLNSDGDLIRRSGSNGEYEEIIYGQIIQDVPRISRFLFSGAERLPILHKYGSLLHVSDREILLGRFKMVLRITECCDSCEQADSNIVDMEARVINSTFSRLALIDKFQGYVMEIRHEDAQRAFPTTP